MPLHSKSKILTPNFNNQDIKTLQNVVEGFNSKISSFLTNKKSPGVLY